jgi:Gluconate 2-dehydrogenase subunit 3
LPTSTARGICKEWSPRFRGQKMFMGASENKIDERKPGVALTRREWLMSLGSAVILSGFRGAPGLVQTDSHAARAPLPPGLYEPSLGHLSHALDSKGAFLPIRPGAATAYARPHPGRFVPQAFTQEEFAVVRRLVEIILGEDLKNASEKLARGAPASIYDEVAEWIDLVVASAPGTRTVALNLQADQRALAIAYFGSEQPVRYLESFGPESVCREGLAWLGEESQRRIAKGFLDVDASGQAELVRAISDARPDRSATHAGTRLFDFLKEETIRAFYTSRMGLKELDYQGNSFYGQSPGCGLPLRLRPTASEPE